jgi:hypothetical protein
MKVKIAMCGVTVRCLCRVIVAPRLLQVLTKAKIAAAQNV